MVADRAEHAIGVTSTSGDRLTAVHDATLTRVSSVPTPGRAKTETELVLEQRRETYHLVIDRAITNALRELSLCPGNVPGRGFESTSRGVDRQLPVNDKGRAKGDTALADLQQRAVGAGSIMAKRAVLDAIKAEIDSVRVARRVGWADRGTLEGRLMIARYARAHGQAMAARAFDVSQPTVSRYVSELKQQEAKTA